MIRSASLSCGPQSHFSEPNTSPVRHSLCSRTSGGLPPNAPITSATCSCPSSEARKATICVSRHVVERQFARGRRSRPPARDRSRAMSSAETPASAASGVEQPQRRQQPRRAAPARARPRPSRRNRAAPDGAARSAPRSRSRPGSAIASAVVGVEPGRALDQHRLRRVGRVALVGELQRRGALAADQQPRRCARDRRRSSSSGVAGLDREDRDRLARRRSAPAARRAARRSPGGSARRAQTSISQISGTWSDGRSQLRHGSST